MRITLYFLMVFILCNCKNVVKNDNQDTDQGFTSNSVERATKSYDLKWEPGSPLPSACGLVSVSTLSKLFGVDEGAIIVKDGNPNATDSRSCFFKWDDPSYPNTGVLVQVSKNPMADELPDWASYVVSNKRSVGETVMGNSDPSKFNLWLHVGNDGAYNYDVGKYYWRLNHDLVCMIAYNMYIKPEDQLKTANYISTEVTNNLTN